MEKVVTSCEKQVSTFEGKITTISENLIDRYTLADNLLSTKATKSNKENNQAEVLEDVGSTQKEKPSSLGNSEKLMHAMKRSKEEIITAVEKAKESIKTDITDWKDDLKSDIAKIETKAEAETNNNLYSTKLLEIEQNTKSTCQKTNNVRKELVKMSLLNERSQLQNSKDPLIRAGGIGKAIEYKQQNTVLIKGIKTREYLSKDAIVLKRNLGKIFPQIPHIPIDIAMTTTSGTVQYQFRESEHAERIINGWKSDYFGGGTKAVKPQEQTTIGIARDVPIEYTEDELKEEILEEYNAIDIKRLMRNGVPIPVVKIFFKAAENLQTAVKLGIKLKEGLLIPVEESTTRSGRIIRCYNCQKFGHVQTRCTRTKRCVKCGEEGHSHQENGEAKCINNEVVKCSNCGEKHQANSYICTKYQEIRQQIGSNGRLFNITKGNKYNMKTNNDE